jgi:tetratricopeptide (TPR) repeat protein
VKKDPVAPILASSLIVVIILTTHLGGIPFVFSLRHAHAELQSSQQTPLLSTEPNRRVIVFDNDTLDKMFGKSRRSAANETDAVKIPGKSDFPAVGPNRSLLSAIGRGTSSKRAAALRLVESGRTLIQAGENRRAVAVLERALSLEASPFVYFYLARAHYYLADYQRAAEFVEIAEALFYQQPDWSEELFKLKTVLSTSRGGPEIRPRQNIGWAEAR